MVNAIHLSRDDKPRSETAWTLWKGRNCKNIPGGIKKMIILFESGYHTYKCEFEGKACPAETHGVLTFKTKKNGNMVRIQNASVKLIADSTLDITITNS